MDPHASFCQFHARTGARGLHPTGSDSYLGFNTCSEQMVSGTSPAAARPVHPRLRLHGASTRGAGGGLSAGAGRWRVQLSLLRVSHRLCHEPAGQPSGGDRTTEGLSFIICKRQNK